MLMRGFLCIELCIILILIRIYGCAKLVYFVVFYIELNQVEMVGLKNKSFKVALSDNAIHHQVFESS